MNIIEAIKARRSVRTYNSEPLHAHQRKELLDFIGQLENPFGGCFSIDLKAFDLKNGYRPSTYGMIKGATDFFLLSMADDDLSAFAAGFCFEQVVLKAWQLGLGTCWIAATFKNTDFEKDLQLRSNEKLRIVSPVGVAAKQSIIERVSRIAVGSNNRKPFGELFFNDDFNTPLMPDSRYGKALEMLRLAPSSTNSQPWRAIVAGDTVHFYYTSKSSLSVLDCGIGISHFYLAEKFKGNNGTFYKEKFAPTHKDWKYLISYR